MRNQKGQGALEYLLLIGGAVLVAAIVIVLLLGINSQSTSTTGLTTATALCNQKAAGLNPGNPIAVCSKNGKWVSPGDEDNKETLHTSDGYLSDGISINLITVVAADKVYACGGYLPKCVAFCDPFADPRPYDRSGKMTLKAQIC